MGDKCFTILSQFLPQINMSQPQVYICPLPREPPIHLPPHPTPLSFHRALGLNSLHNIATCHSLFILYIICGEVYVSVTHPICHTLSFHSCVHVSGIYVYISIAVMLIDSSVPSFQISYIGINIFVFLFLTYLYYYLYQILGSPILLELSQMCLFLWLNNTPLYRTITTSSFFIFFSSLPHPLALLYSSQWQKLSFYL